MPKPALLIISAASVVGENRKRLDTLARFFDLTCVTCRSVRSIGFDVTLEPASEPREYRLLPLPTLGRAETTTRYLLRGLGRALAGLRFDAVLVESEPWAWVRWQTWLYTRLRHRRAIFGEFSWENSARPGLKGALLGVCYRLACRTDNFAIAGNRAAGELFLSHGLDSARLLVAPQLGVDETLFCPPAPDARSGARIREGLAPQAFVVGFCGRFIREKGVLDLVDAVDAAHTSHPGRAIQLALLGSGPLGAELGRMAAQRPWLRLLASRSHGEVAGFMQLLDLFVLPSKPGRSSSATCSSRRWRAESPASAQIPARSRRSSVIPRPSSRRAIASR